ncbi:hypothetical protein D623_10007161 [Myotis brandtii]|uniref:Uncharacterized protein n=1 Tax=Myotis brandtii TaxID=109478 RepID=S7PW99_MYOBR|nr:hypothetical protein D623_10007161 [Myotis brandtii]
MDPFPNWSLRATPLVPDGVPPWHCRPDAPYLTAGEVGSNHVAAERNLPDFNTIRMVLLTLLVSVKCVVDER